MLKKNKVFFLIYNLINLQYGIISHYKKSKT